MCFQLVQIEPMPYIYIYISQINLVPPPLMKLFSETDNWSTSLLSLENRNFVCLFVVTDYQDIKWTDPHGSQTMRQILGSGNNRIILSVSEKSFIKGVLFFFFFKLQKYLWKKVSISYRFQFSQKKCWLHTNFKILHM